MYRHVLRFHRIIEALEIRVREGWRDVRVLRVWGAAPGRELLEVAAQEGGDAVRE